MELTVERLIRHATPLLFGIYGHAIGEKGEINIKVGGSGVFIAPFLAITARHVSRELLKFDYRAERPPKGTFEAQFGSSIFQLHEPFGGKPVHAVWKVDRSWDSRFTDISLMQVSADSGLALQFQKEMPRTFLEWRFLPPHLGGKVTLLGFPQTSITQLNDEFRIDTNFILQEAAIVDVHYPWRDRGMLNFPCYELNMPVDHGFSGGPAFFDGRLCGIVASGTSYDNRSYITALWPLALMEYDYAGLGGKTTFRDLVDRGAIKSIDWPEIRSRIAICSDEHGEEYACLKER